MDVSIPKPKCMSASRHKYGTIKLTIQIAYTYIYKKNILYKLFQNIVTWMVLKKLENTELTKLSTLISLIRDKIIMKLKIHSTF